MFLCCSACWGLFFWLDVFLLFFFFQGEDGIRDWGVTGSSDVCSSDLIAEKLLVMKSMNRNVESEQEIYCSDACYANNV